ncbi:hypothetical protein JW859_07625 [bacterium]|nr:hypothetical protein [bacterium]
MTTQHPITMDQVVGTKVVIKLHRQAYEMLDLQGIESERFVARVVGVDGFGLWVENPEYTTIPVYNDDGEYIPPEERGEVVHRAVFLLQWPYIQTILQFPDRPAYRGGVDEAEIGFKAKVRREEDQGG